MALYLVDLSKGIIIAQHSVLNPQINFGSDVISRLELAKSDQGLREFNEAIQNGLKLGIIESGQRDKPDGTVLNWKLTDPYALPMDGTIPFIISWGKTPHPAKAVPKAGELISLEIQHPEPDEVNQKLKLLGIHMLAVEGREVKLRAKIRTKNGLVVLE